MAIIIEEEGNKMNVVHLVGWLVFFAVVVVAAYYLFFASPQLIVVPPPNGYENIAPIAGYTIQPQDVLQSPAFQALKQPPFPLPSPSGPAVGRSNPFVAP